MNIACLGDSFTQGYLIRNNYTRFLEKAGFDIVNLGKNGDTTQGMLERVPKEKFDLLIVFGASNDFYEGLSPTIAYKNIKSILSRTSASKTLLIIPPYIEEEEAYLFYGQVNEKIDEFADLLYSAGFYLVDARKVKPSYIDGLHMREDFHKDLAKLIIRKIREMYD